MESPPYSHQWFQLTLLIIFSATASTAMRFNVPRLSPVRGTFFRALEILSEPLSEDFQTFFYNQTLDHFNYKPESYVTFPQRYVINFKHWGGANVSAPIFVYFGAEEPLDQGMRSVGFLTDHGFQFNALLVYIEHRYYGKSIPFGSREEAMKNASTLGYFNSVQAIADYAEVLVHIKEELRAHKSPVIVVGGSYGGMLASWFRLKYPHIGLGALASSAPVLYFDDITPQDGYYSVVSKNFQDASQTCYQTIKNSWSAIDEVASTSDGLSFLSKRFKTCSPLKDSHELKDYLQSVYASAAQYDSPSVASICRGIDEASYGSDPISRIFAGLVFDIASSDRSCLINPPKNASETDYGWGWQKCSEMVLPIGRGNDSMFEPAPFNLASFSRDCESFYGVPPRPHWVTTFYGGHDTKLILKRFGSNIIFSNGLKDPYSSGGVLEDISDTILAVKTVNGTHCQDISFEKENDPQWLVNQRKTELEIIRKWITQYYADLRS